MSIITVTAGHLANICVTRRNSRRIRWASMLTPKRWLPPARREHRRGTCTSVPGRANLPPRNLTILGSFSKEITRRRIGCDATPPDKHPGVGILWHSVRRVWIERLRFLGLREFCELAGPIEKFFA